MDKSCDVTKEKDDRLLVMSRDLRIMEKRREKMTEDEIK